MLSKFYLVLAHAVAMLKASKKLLHFFKPGLRIISSTQVAILVICTGAIPEYKDVLDGDVLFLEWAVQCMHT